MAEFDTARSRATSYVLRVEAVRKSVESLAHSQLHEHLPGYLAIYQAAKKDKGQADPSDIVAFYDEYLAARGATEQKPYIQCFLSRGSRPRLQNRNVAGSYSPSSIRSDGRLQGVINVNGEGRDTYYTLPDDHASRAHTSLLKGNRIPAVAMSVFMLRDYAFEVSQAVVAGEYVGSAEPSLTGVVDIFRNEFFLREDFEIEKNVYNLLFRDDSKDFEGSWFELYSGNADLE